VNYVGSITIDAELLDQARLAPGERVLVVDNTNGSRLETYVIERERGSGQICMNGAAALLINSEDEIIVMGFELNTTSVKAALILVDG